MPVNDFSVSAIRWHRKSGAISHTHRMTDGGSGRSWHVLLVGGASGTGKSTACTTLMQRFLIFGRHPAGYVFTRGLSIGAALDPYFSRYFSDPPATAPPARRFGDLAEDLSAEPAPDLPRRAGEAPGNTDL